MSIRAVNPANGEVLSSYESMSDALVKTKLRLAERRAIEWADVPLVQRATLVRRLADVLEEGKAGWARQMTLEMGKPIGAAEAEVQKCALGCRYAADHAAAWLADELVATEARRSFIRYEPLGVILAIMPWNFPFWQCFRFAASALMAGNVALLKHASNVPGCALAIEEIFCRAGFPDGAFQTLLVGAEGVPQLIANPVIRAVTLTGSKPAGASVAALAGAQIKKVVLELGGNDPFIVMPSADLDRAVRVGVQARTGNAGQSCIAAKRFIVHEAVADAFEQAFVTQMAALRVGDPLDPQTQIGPLATVAILEELDRQVQKTLALGAQLLVGGRRLDRPGNFYTPTVLTRVRQDSPTWTQETFGPVASLVRVSSLEDALSLANDTPFGLGASAWTSDAGEQEQFVARLQTGAVFVNALVASDPRLPFGGTKGSGLGRELAQAGIREFVNAKTVWVA